MIPLNIPGKPASQMVHEKLVTSCSFQPQSKPQICMKHKTPWNIHSSCNHLQVEIILCLHYHKLIPSGQDILEVVPEIICH